MKKILSIVMISSLLTCVIFASGCSTSSDAGSSDKLKVVATVFPVYDWTREIVGDSKDVELSLLVDNASDLHSYQPSAQDIAEITSCDVLIYVGGTSDSWIGDAVGSNADSDTVVIDLIDVLGDSEGTLTVHDGAQSADGGHDDHDDHDENEIDEHVWLSLKNAVKFVDYIADKLSQADKTNAETYSSNAKSYVSVLSALDDEYSQTVSQSENKTLVFADRFPFAYLAEDYSLSCYAAFDGCSSETQADFETVKFLSEKVDEYALPCVLVIEGSDKKIAQTVVENTTDKTARILTLNSLQSVSPQDIESGETYASVMEDNLAVLRQALGLGETESRAS